MTRTPKRRRRVIGAPSDQRGAIVAEAAQRAADRHASAPDTSIGYLVHLLVDELARMVAEARGWRAS